MSAIQAAVSAASVTATNYPAQLAALGVTSQQAAVIRYAVADAYMVAAAQTNGGQVPQSAQDYVTANSAQILAAGVNGVSAIGGMSAINTAVSSATTVGAAVWADMRNLNTAGLPVGIPAGGSWIPTSWPVVTSTASNWTYTHPSSAGAAVGITMGYGGVNNIGGVNAAHAAVLLGWLQAAMVNPHGSPLPVATTYYGGYGTSYWGGTYFVGWPSYFSFTWNPAVNQSVVYVVGNASGVEAIYEAGMAVGAGVAGHWGTPGTGSVLQPADGAPIFSEFLNVPGGIWNLDQGLYAHTSPGSSDVAPGLIEFAPGDPSIWQRAQQGPLFGNGYGLPLGAGGPSQGLKDAAASLDAIINGFGDWGAFNFVKDILHWFVIPITSVMRGMAAVIDFFAGLLDQFQVWVSVMLMPTQQAAQLQLSPIFLGMKASFDATAIGKIVNLVQSVQTSLGSAVNAAPVSLNLNMPIYGHTIVVPLESWLDTVEPYRGFLMIGVYLVFIGEFFGHFKPFIQ
jgi:hypothetical protein